MNLKKIVLVLCFFTLSIYAFFQTVNLPVGVTTDVSIFSKKKVVKGKDLFVIKEFSTPYSDSSTISKDRVEDKHSLLRKKPDNEIHQNIPWKKLQKEWHRQLRDYIIQINPNDGDYMFERYRVAQADYLKRHYEIGLKIQKLYEEKVLNKDLEKKLINESSDIMEQAVSINKKIFGPNYKQVRDFLHEYESSIQVYSRDINLSVDFGFE
jgi:hypothetical protein